MLLSGNLYLQSDSTIKDLKITDKGKHDKIRAVLAIPLTHSPLLQPVMLLKHCLFSTGTVHLQFSQLKVWGVT